MMTRRAVGYRSKRCWCWFPGIRPEQSKCFSHIFSQLLLLLLCPIYVWIGVSSSQEKTNSLFWLAGLWMFRHRVAAPPPPPSYPMACRTQWRPTLSDKTSFSPCLLPSLLFFLTLFVWECQPSVCLCLAPKTFSLLLSLSSFYLLIRKQTSPKVACFQSNSFLQFGFSSHSFPPSATAESPSWSSSSLMSTNHPK